MRISVLFLLITLIFSCTPDDAVDPLSKDYGRGLYILTDNGITYYDYTSSDSNKIIEENIFTKINGKSLSDVRSLNIYGDYLYIVTQHSVHKVDIQTFSEESIVSEFIDAQHCEYAKYNRLYVSDKGDSKIKVINMLSDVVTSYIETGENVSPGSIFVNLGRAFVINEGGVGSDYDSTLISIDLDDPTGPINQFAGNIIVGKNPVGISALGSVIVLCKGIYDPSNSANSTESSIYLVGASSLNVVNSFVLDNIYNAGNLFMNKSLSKLYFTSSTGVHYVETNSFTPTSVIQSKIPSILSINRENFYDNIDSINKSVDFIYMNDINTPGYIYKYNKYIDQFVDSFQISGSPIDMKFY